MTQHMETPPGPETEGRDDNTTTNESNAWLNYWYSETPDERIVISAFKPRGYHEAFTDTQRATMYADALNDCGAECVYFRGTTVAADATITDRARGRDTDSKSMIGIIQDLDILGPGHKAGHYPPTLDGWDELCAQIGIPAPSAEIASGGGYYRAWKFSTPLDVSTPEGLARGNRINQRFHALVNNAAKARGWKLDACKDLSRVWGLPGTWNRKPEMREPAKRTTIHTNGPLYTVEQVEKILDTLEPAISQTSNSAPAPNTPVATATDSPSGLLAAPSGEEHDTEWFYAKLRDYSTQLRTAHQHNDFNNTLNAMSVFAGHGDASLDGLRGHLEREVERVTTAVWGNGLDKSDRDTIASGYARGAAAPWLIRDATASGAVEQAPMNLPPSFWEARPSLALIRDAAHARIAAPDAVLGGVLAHVSAMLPPECGPDTGKGGKVTSLNLFVGLVAPSGGGKSSSTRLTRSLMPATGDYDVWTMPLGSGEGISEAYMGYVDEAIIDEDGNDTGKTRKVRRKVRDGVLFTKDEGAELVRVLERQGSTVGESLRSTWMAEQVGQMNGSAERTRILPAASYSAGMVIGFQPVAAAGLFTEYEIGVGTPQRFLWMSAVDPGIPDEAPEATGKLRLHLTGFEPATVSADPLRFVITDAMRKRIRSESLARARGEAVVAPLDGHRTLMVVKVGCLLAAIEGRNVTTDEDFELAEQVVTMSDVVRTGIRNEAARREERAMASQLRKARSEGRAAEQGRRDEAEDRAANCLEQHVSLLVEKIRRAGSGGIASSDMRLKATHRGCAADALSQIEERGWARRDGRRFYAT